MKIYRTLDTLTVRPLAVFGDICSALGYLPTSIVISKGLEKDGTLPFDSGGMMDYWWGKDGRGRVAVKNFRTYPDAPMAKAQKVLRFEHP